MNQRILTMTAIGAMAASMALAGCDKGDRTDARTAANDSVARVDQKARELGSDASNSMDRAKDAAANATAKMGDKIDDAVITTSVKRYHFQMLPELNTARNDSMVG